MCRLHQMHEIQTIVICNSGICLSVRGWAKTAEWIDIIFVVEGVSRSHSEGRGFDAAFAKFICQLVDSSLLVLISYYPCCLLHFSLCT